MAAQVQAAPPAMFAAPPAGGEVAGVAESIGLRGLSIHLPALTLELPTIRFPSFVRYRRDAHINLDAGRAYLTPTAQAFGPTGFSAAAVSAAPFPAHAHAAPPAAQVQVQPPEKKKPCDDLSRTEVELRKRQAQLEALEKKIDHLQRTMKQLPVPPRPEQLPPPHTQAPCPHHGDGAGTIRAGPAMANLSPPVVEARPLSFEQPLAEWQEPQTQGRSSYFRPAPAQHFPASPIHRLPPVK